MRRILPSIKFYVALKGSVKKKKRSFYGSSNLSYIFVVFQVALTSIFHLAACLYVGAVML